MGREVTDTQGRLPSWALVNARQNEELRARELVEKLEEAERLMMSIDDFGWRTTLDDDAPIRERWNRLRQLLGPGARPTP
jgi:hypothetical protein